MHNVNNILNSPGHIKLSLSQIQEKLTMKTINKVREREHCVRGGEVST